jgi:hypothetical protein
MTIERRDERLFFRAGFTTGVLIEGGFDSG